MNSIWKDERHIPLDSQERHSRESQPPNTARPEPIDAQPERVSPSDASEGPADLRPQLKNYELGVGASCHSPTPSMINTAPANSPEEKDQRNTQDAPSNVSSAGASERPTERKRVV